MKSIYQLKNSPIWLGLALLWMIAQLPYSLQLRIGKWIGHLIRHFFPKARRTTETNLALCFPELTEKERQILMIKNFESSGIGLIEAAIAWWGKADPLLPLFHIHGMEHVQNSLKKGRGVLLCSAHFSPLELGGRLLSKKLSFSVMYRPQKNPVFNHVIHKYRTQFYEDVIARTDLRKLVRYLKENKIVWYTADIDGGVKNSVFVPFFNIQTASLTMTARLAEMTGADVIPVVGYRRDDGTGYDIYIGPTLENYPSGNLESDTLRINHIIEKAIRHKPEDYIWQYKRFKTRPPGEPRFYK